MLFGRLEVDSTDMLFGCLEASAESSLWLMARCFGLEAVDDDDDDDDDEDDELVAVLVVFIAREVGGILAPQLLGWC